MAESDRAGRSMTAVNLSGLEARAPAKPGRFRFMELARHAAIVGIAGVITGFVVGGIGGRILMRIAAVAADDRIMGATTENGNSIGEITLDGTIELLIFVGILLGLIGAIAFLISEPWLAWTGRWRGLTFGGFLLAIGSIGGIDADNIDFFIVGNQELTVAMFIALYFGFGALIVPIIHQLEQRLPAIDPQRPVAGGWGYVVLATFGAQFLLLFFFQFFRDDANAGDAPVLTGIMLIGLAVATAWLLAGGLRHSPPADRSAQVVNLVGYGFLSAAVVVGSVRAIDDISRILSL